MSHLSLVAQLELFESGADRSVQWAKDTESLLDQIALWDELIDDLQDQLALYRPGGGPHLVDEHEMARIVVSALKVLRKEPNSQNQISVLKNE